MEKGLNRKQQNYCTRRVQGYSAKEAAVMAGYSETTAIYQAHRWDKRPEFKECIEKFLGYIDQIDNAIELARETKKPET